MVELQNVCMGIYKFSVLYYRGPVIRYIMEEWRDYAAGVGWWNLEDAGLRPQRTWFDCEKSPRCSGVWMLAHHLVALFW